jgi:hypothetical protein
MRDLLRERATAARVLTKARQHLSRGRMVGARPQILHLITFRTSTMPHDTQSEATVSSLMEQVYFAF